MSLGLTGGMVLLIFLRSGTINLIVLATLHAHRVSRVTRARILVQVTIYRRLLIGQDDHLDQSEAYDIS